ncbi:branched-chain amino acid ABC transporter permease [Haloarchaeobius sp. DYHT-AS-18]|uniref:branched-chain amino acid ABC transporter permease n=1 Tax=Haloarchaeobius sp. DYHT-AS-18 TaxID=3446117 RepID=UPI003EBFC7F4
MIHTELPTVVAQSVSYYFTQTFNGLVLGMILVLIALGLSIIFGMMGIINFAHGDLLLVGAYVAWATVGVTGSLLAGLVVAPLVVAVLGVAFERVGLRRIYGENVLLQVLLTFGLAEFLRAGVEAVWGPGGKNFAIPDWGTGSVDLVLFSYPTYRLFVISLSAVLILGIHLFLTRTDFGLIVRAGTQDRQMVDALGIDISWVFMVVFAIGTALAGVAGALIGPIRGAYPTLGIELLVPAFVVIVIGGIGSFRGTVISGILIGELIVLTGVVYSPAANVIIYVFMAVVLLVKPHGLFGEEGVFH